MFKFGFSNDSADGDNCDNAIEDKGCTSWLPCEEITLKNNSVPKELLEDDCPDINSIEVNELKIKYVSCEIVTSIISKKKNSKNSIFKAERDKSDLITAIYEGGLKIWQCTYDLLTHVSQLNLQFEGKKILDLGCGAGIVGLYAFLNGSKVYFQDYNPEVLKYITLPNVLLNQNESNKIEACKFYSGDWQSFYNKIIKDFAVESEKFDYIFTSETIYNCDNYGKLTTIFKDCLKRNGEIYLAAKTYYFGVGGGTRQFEDLLRLDGKFKYETCWKNLDGVQREILKLNFI